MLTASTRFLSMLRVPHQVVIRATIEQPGNAPVVVPVLGGSISVDEAAATRRSGTLTIPWTTAEESTEALGIDLRTLPFGSYVLLERGVRFANGETELVTVGRLRVNAVSWQTSEKVATIDLADRMAQLADTYLPPFTPSGLDAAEVIEALVFAVFGSEITYTIETAGGLPNVVGATYEGTRADAVADLAASIGAAAFFDVEGNFVLRPVQAEPDTIAVWSIDAGAEGVLVDADESLDRTRTYSGVLVRGTTAAGVPIEKLARNLDPASPTYGDGPFGAVVLVYESEAVTTQAQADTLALELLARYQGLTRSLTVTSVPNPALETGDTVRLLFPDGRDELHLIAALTVPLDATSPGQLVTKTPGEPAAAVLDLRATGGLAAMMGAG